MPDNTVFGPGHANIKPLWASRDARADMDELGHEFRDGDTSDVERWAREQYGYDSPMYNFCMFGPGDRADRIEAEA